MGHDSSYEFSAREGGADAASVIVIDSELVSKRELRAIRFAAEINIFGLALASLWNPLNAVILPDLVRGMVPSALQGSGLGVITFLGVGTAALVQPFAGRINDRIRLPNRRRAFVVGGSVATVAALLLLAKAPNFWWLVGCYVLLQLGGNVAQAAFQAFIPTLVDERERGLASGVKSGLNVIGIIVGLGGASALFALGASVFVVLLYLGSIILLCSALTVVWVPGSPPPDEEGGSVVDVRAMLRSFQNAFREHEAFRLAVVTRFVFLLGIYPLQRLFLYYLENRFEITELEQISVYLVVAVLIAAAAAGVSGLVSDRMGRVPVLGVAILFGTAGIFGMALAPTLIVAGVAGGCAAIGLGSFEAVNWAQLSDQIPEDQEAEYFGLANLATAGSSALAGVFGPLADMVNAVFPAGTYDLTFGLAAVVALASFIPLTRLRKLTTEEI